MRRSVARSVRKHVSTRDASMGEKTRAPKKMAASGEAAKFREETPRKGGGFAGDPQYRAAAK